MDCDEVNETLDAYALGALDGSEREQVERHLETCASCRASADRAVAAAAALGLAAPLLPAPGSLHARLMRQIEQARDPASGGQSSLRRLMVRAPQGRQARLRRFFPSSAREGRRQLAWLQPLAASVAVLLLLGAGVWIVRMQPQLNRLQARSQALQRGMADFEGQRAALMLLASEGTVRYEMQAANPGAGSAGAVIWNPDRHVCSVFVSGLPPAPAGQTYHVWLVGDHRSWDSGELATSPGGLAEKTIDLTSMSNDSGYEIVVSLDQRQGAGSAWQPVLKAWVGIQ
jgi:hypothetical protein